MDIGNVQMKAQIKDSSDSIHTAGDELLPVTFTAKNVQLDAFRSTEVEPDQLQTPLDCSFRPRLGPVFAIPPDRVGFVDNTLFCMNSLCLV